VNARAGSMAGYVATAIYALNPNLLYLQTTAMNEPIFLAFFIWALVYLDEFLRATSPTAPTELKPRRPLEYCGIMMAGGALTRYDGWFSASIIGVILLVAFLRWRGRAADSPLRRAVSKSFVEVLALNALVPVYWLVYTWAVSGNALDFINGPYSAKAIALRSTARGAPPYPGEHHVFTAALYFLKSAQLNMGAPVFGRVLLALAVIGSGIAIWRFRRYGLLLLLWIPLAFYGFSVAYGSVPIYIPVWYPFSYYNVRYGLELLPVFAVFPVIVASLIADRAANRSIRVAVWAALAIGIVGSGYMSAYANAPITVREARANSRWRMALEDGLARQLEKLPPSATLLMYEAEHPNALREAGIPLRHVISENEHPDWEWALLDPAHQADYIVACQGDPAWGAARNHRAELTELATVTAPWQASCTIYERKYERQ